MILSLLAVIFVFLHSQQKSTTSPPIEPMKHFLFSIIEHHGLIERAQPELVIPDSTLENHESMRNRTELKVLLDEYLKLIKEPLTDEKKQALSINKYRDNLF